MKAFIRAKFISFGLWISAHGGYTKLMAAGIVIAGLAYGSVPPFHDYCVFVWGLLPTALKTLLVTASALYAWLRNPATRKVIDSLLGPGDELKLKDPVLDVSANTVSASSATVTKADVPPKPEA